MAKILIVEDNDDLCQVIRQALEAEHHKVEIASNGTDGKHLILSYKYDLAVLDWELPGTSGLDICQSYRSNGGAAPILMLTGRKDIGDKVAGFESGADDYLTKPFIIKELQVRVRALLRRPGEVARDILSVRDLTIDPIKYLVSRQGKDIKLLPREFALLEFFARHPNRPFSPDQLLDSVWESSADASVEAVVVCIGRLRRKIDEPGRESLIRTIHGIGYQLDS